MELLVSVRSGAEVESALAGGADIIDAKEPARGSLGPVSHAMLAEILAAVPGERALSIALGDFSHPDQLLEALASRPLPARPGAIYLKLGFAGVSVSARIESMVATAVTASRLIGSAPRIVVVAYADSERAQTAAPDRIREIAAECGAEGVLLDTWVKDGRGLLGCMNQAFLHRWVEHGKDAGLLTALAGELKLEDIEAVGRAGAAVVGVRGAACDGGRGGRLNASRVRALREQAKLNSGFFQGVVSPSRRNGGETRDAGAISRYGEVP